MLFFGKYQPFFITYFCGGSPIFAVGVLSLHWDVVKGAGGVSRELSSRGGDCSRVLGCAKLFKKMRKLGVLINMIEGGFATVFLKPSNVKLLSLFGSASGFLSSTSGLNVPADNIEIISITSAKDKVSRTITRIHSLYLLSTFLNTLVYTLLNPLLGLFAFS